MPLFHPRVLKRILSNSREIPTAHEAILAAWARNLAKGIYDRETQNDSEFIQKILMEVLGYVGSSAGDTWTLAKNQPVGSGNVDVALGHFGVDGTTEIYAPFELKGAVTKDIDALMPGRHKSPVQQAWEYAMDAKGAKWVLISNYREIRLYAVGYGRKDYEAFDLSLMTQPANYHRFMLLLSANNLLSGATLKLLRDSDSTQKEITAQLYSEYKSTRSHLIGEIRSGSPPFPPLKAVQLAQTILDRVLFVAFAEDKGLLTKGTLADAYKAKNPYNPQPAWENFKGLFHAVDQGNERLSIPGYNGGLFADNSDINALAVSDDLCKRFADLGKYDYESEVSVNILGHVFEQSITDLEDLKSELDPTAAPPAEVGSKRRTDGIFYTPPFVTRHIVEQSVGRWLADQKSELGFFEMRPLSDEDYSSIKHVRRGRNHGKVVYNANVANHIAFWSAYRQRLSAIKVIDPACGSGAFLNEVFDFLYREGQTINRTLEALNGGQINLFRWDTHILANNLYGVDINRESVEITKLSLWLKTANRNEKLSYLDDKIKAGNSLVKDRGISGNLAFDWSTEFREVMEAGGFDVVLGNPPYVDSEAMAKAWPREREYISKTFEQARGNWDLYVAFLELGCNLISKRGYLSYITPDKWIAKDFGAAIRQRILPGIVSILPIGRDVFESAIVDSIITTISAQPVASLQVLAIVTGEVEVLSEVEKSELGGDQGFDQALSSHYVLLRKLEQKGLRRLRDIARTENACATSDTYILGNYITDAGSGHGYNPRLHYKIANTGTLSRFGFRWGIRPMRYLKNDYLYPIIEKATFRSHLGGTYQRRAASPKVIIKGLTLLDAALDLDGSYIPGKSTLVICHDDLATLKFVAGIVNSAPASFYVKEKYASASYNGGVNFTPDMLDSIPVPASVDEATIVKNVDKILSALDAVSTATARIQKLVRSATGSLKLGRSFDRWYDISNTEFIQELRKAGLKLSIAEAAEWIDILEKSKAAVTDNLSAFKTGSDAIDCLLLDAFGLDQRDRERISDYGNAPSP